MDDRIKLELDSLTVTTFTPMPEPSVSYSFVVAQQIDSWPGCGTCIDICAPTEDIRCQ